MKVAAAAVAMAALTVIWRLLTFSGFTNDQYAHLALAQQLLLGDWPVRDFSDPGLPLTYIVSAAAWQIWGGTIATEWALSTAAFALGTGCIVFVASRLARSVWVAVLAGGLLILLLPRDYGYPKILLYGGAAAAVLAATVQPTTRRTAALGAVIALAFLFRHDHGLYVGTTALVAVVVMAGRQWRTLVREIATLGAGALLVLLPWLAFLAFNDPVEYVRNAIAFARAEANVTVLDELPRFAVADPFSRDNAAAWLFWLFWALPAVSCLIALRRGESWRGERAVVLALCAMAALVNLGFLRDLLTVRVPDAAAPAAVLGAWLLGLAWRSTGWRAACRLTAVLLCLVTAAATGRLTRVGDNLERAGVTDGSLADSAEQSLEYLRYTHREAAPSRVSRALVPFYSYLDRCSTRDDRLVVTNFYPDILVLAERGFAGGVMAFALGHALPEHQNRILRRLVHAPPLFVFVTSDEFAGRYPQLAQYVDLWYRPLRDWPVSEVGTIRILVDQRRSPRGTDAETGLPCFRSG